MLFSDNPLDQKNQWFSKFTDWLPSFGRRKSIRKNDFITKFKKLRDYVDTVKDEHEQARLHKALDDLAEKSVNLMIQMRMTSNQFPRKTEKSIVDEMMINFLEQFGFHEAEQRNR